MKAGLKVNAYRFRGWNLKGAKRGDFNSRWSWFLEWNFLVEGLINSDLSVEGENFLRTAVPYIYYRVVYKLFIMGKKFFSYRKFVKEE